ncbi:uncharacterized protein LOC117326856 isoform X2 [Pecten maximus]|uniref:uncharacterized protein LOC117326856 isoform X2 n=1 Tax=Pecten maximus TaxID=6579 RepID=UPI00145831F6|nr:uncharacterized protein LOC117326856 isoform X2 [Pecten maximus]
MQTKMSKKSLHVHWRCEEDRTESNGEVQPVLNGILKNSTTNGKNEIIPEKQTPVQQQTNNKRLQNFIDAQDPKRQRQNIQNVQQIRQKQRAPLPPNIGSRTYNPVPVPTPANRKMFGAGVPQQYVYLQQSGGSTRRYPPGYRSSRPQSAHNQINHSRTLPPYRIVPPQLGLSRMDDNSPQVRLGRYRPKVIQEHFSPNNIRDAEFLNKRREQSAPDKRKSVQTHTWQKQGSAEAKVTRQDANLSTLRTKTIVRLKASPIQSHNPQWKHRLVSSVTIPPRSSQEDDNGNYVIVDYVVDNLGPQMLQMKLTENGDTDMVTRGVGNGQGDTDMVTRGVGNGQVNNGPTNSGNTTAISTASEKEVEMIEMQKQVLQESL